MYKRVKSGYKFLIGKHSGYHKWVLPKGLIEKGEDSREAAEREVEEEVGVKASIIDLRPLKTIEYFYVADLQNEKGVGANGEESVRRVIRYQENGGGKERVHKQVVFYLMEMKQDLGRAGWEMEERKWVSYQQGLLMLAFESEREVWREMGKALAIGASDQN